MIMGWETRTVSLIICLSILLATIQHGNADRKIVCYYTNWSIYRPGTAKFSPQNINPYLCTHLIYAFGGFTKDNALKPFDKYQDIEKGGYAKFTGLKTYNKNLKTLLAIGGWNEGSSRFSPMVADPDRRRELVKNTVKFLRKNHFDGLDLDWEYPAFRDGGKPRDKDNYASLVQELREEFERESSKTGRPRLLLTMAMPAGIEYIDKGYDVPRLNEYLDFINLLSYDYHSSYEPAVNHHSPLYPLEEDNEYNYDSELTIDYTVNYLMNKGASPEKIILGIPTYGRSYTLFNEDATDLGSPAEGPGVEGDATREKGYLAYYEICESLSASDDWEIVQPNAKAMGPYAFKGDQWVGYDDEDIVKLKAKYANEKKLGGIMFWTIDNDDFRGKCHDRPYPLIEAAKEALLTGSTNTQQTRTSSSRRRVQEVHSNTIGRKFGSANRRTTTTSAPVARKRVTTPRPKFRTSFRSRANAEDDEDREVERRAYDLSSDEEDDSKRGNAVKSSDRSDGPRNRGKGRVKGGSNSGRNRRKQNRRKEGSKDNPDDDSLSNKLTTPEPPTTPDPGSDFKCEDEGFFPHPRDCKKYFWCLDSGPGGLGVVAHQFTCPSGLVFNKAADSCDYPRNVVCPKSKASQSTASTTRAPVTAATSRTTYLYSSTRKPSTEKPESEEEYEYYDDEDEIDEEEEKEEKPPKTTTTPKPLLYKTINRSRPTTTTTTTTTTEAPTTTSKSVVLDFEDEEDPKVIKELIKLIKKAGGIEQLEKQLLLQGKSPEEASSNSEQATPATISRTLYERVLSRQANKIANRQRPSSGNFANGPGGAQFEGLDEVPEVKSLRRSQKPQYVTIHRPKASTKEPPTDDEEDAELEDTEDETADVASSEERRVSNPFLTSSTQRVTPNYVNIRRARPSTTTSRNENDVEEKEEEEEEEVPARRRRPNLSSRSTESNGSSEDTKEQESRSSTSDEALSTTRSRYVSVQRFRSTTAKSETPEDPPKNQVSEEPPKTNESIETTTTPAPTIPPSVSTASNAILDVETESPTTLPSVERASTTEPVKLVEESATEILLTTAAASPSTLPAPSTRISVATVSQPRPFGFNRRQRPTTETPVAATSEQTRPKVASSDAVRLPTLKELISSRTIEHPGNRSPLHLSLLPFAPDNTVLGDGPASLERLNENDLDLARAEADYVEDNVAEEEDASFASKRRFDREDASTTTLKPTTMRGTPLVNLLQSQSSRGFYVTKSEADATASKVESVASEQPSSTEAIIEASTVPSVYIENDTQGLEEDSAGTTQKPRGTIKYSEPAVISNEGNTSRKKIGSVVISTTVSSTIPISSSEVYTTTSFSNDSDVSSVEPEFLTTLASSVNITHKGINESTTESLRSTDIDSTSSTTDPLPETTLVPTSNPTALYYTDKDSESTPINTETTAAEESTSSYEKIADREGRNSTENDGTVTTTVLPVTTAASSTEKPAEVERGRAKFDRRRHRVRPNTNFEFGDRATGRVRSRNRGEEVLKKGEEPPPTLHRVPLYRVRHRRPISTTDNTPPASAQGDKKLKAEEASHLREEESEDRKKLARNSTGDGAKQPEVSPSNPSKNAVGSLRAPGSSSTRFRKPIAISTQLQSRSPNTLDTRENGRPLDRNTTVGTDKHDTLDDVRETGKPVKDIDQSSRAQEIAVTLADPPSSRATSTGRPPFRNAPRRKISTTLAPRTDSTTARTTVRISPAARGGPKAKSKDRPRQNATSRPRRPQVIDYDYYEDEDEPVVGRSSTNGKIFLTSKGTIRCLDQGNFPHPSSCKKFITCAKMVNGLIIGAEYTCPDTLSFDPVGGICNWSAGLGCKE